MYDTSIFPDFERTRECVAYSAKKRGQRVEVWRLAENICPARRRFRTLPLSVCTLEQPPVGVVYISTFVTIALYLPTRTYPAVLTSVPLAFSVPRGRPETSDYYSNPAESGRQSGTEKYYAVAF